MKVATSTAGATCHAHTLIHEWHGSRSPCIYHAEPGLALVRSSGQTVQTRALLLKHPVMVTLPKAEAADAT
eukprot:1148295-Pelagomonas_calceolata.AAC.1